MNNGLHDLRSFLESAALKVTEQQQALVIHFDDHTSLTLQLSLHYHPDDGQRYVQFLIPIGVDIPDQHFLHAAQVIADFNQVSPLGIFSISAESRPYFDYSFQVPAHGECMLNLLEAIQLSHLFAGRLMEFLQRKLREWLMPGFRPQVA
ncbi:MAG: hypothetical protein ACAI44_37970 [Candidatus Sericytochromatia bacterium]